jgi:hypothetical protein
MARRGVAVASHPPIVTSEERARKLEEAIIQLLVKAHQLGVSTEELHAEIERLARGQPHKTITSPQLRVQ